MSLNFETIKKVRPKIHDLIFGYFRESHKKYFDSNGDNPYYSIQSLLVYTCIAYYFRNEWDTQNMSKIEDGDTTVLIKDEISSAIHEYAIEIIKCAKAVNGGYFDLIFGIIDSKVLQEDRNKNFVNDCME